MGSWRDWWNGLVDLGELDNDSLRRRTEEYWGEVEYHATEEAHCLSCYVENLLPYELACAERAGRLFAHDCDTLVLLVGYSLEPLFQAIGFYQPERVILILNRLYGEQSGLGRGADVAEWIDQELSSRLNYKPEIQRFETDDRPDAVFRTLCEKILPLRQSGHQVLVDITGAR